jgi:hypothetical protein
MFFKRRSRDEMHEAHVVDLKEAHEARVREMMRLVDALAEQVEYLRAQLGRPFIAAGHPGLNPTNQPVAVHALDGDSAPLHVSEEEEDLLALHELGHVDDWELETLRGQLGLHTVSRDS